MFVYFSSSLYTLSLLAPSLPLLLLLGWHEARIPTIATRVPRAAYTWVTQKLKGEVAVPLVSTNRINTPEIAEFVLSEGHSDMVGAPAQMFQIISIRAMPNVVTPFFHFI